MVFAQYPGRFRGTIRDGTASGEARDTQITATNLASAVCLPLSFPPPLEPLNSSAGGGSAQVFSAIIPTGAIAFAPGRGTLHRDSGAAKGLGRAYTSGHGTRLPVSSTGNRPVSSRCRTLACNDSASGGSSASARAVGTRAASGAI